MSMGLVTSKDAVETKHGGGVPTPGVPWKQRQWPASEQELRMVVSPDCCLSPTWPTPEPLPMPLLNVALGSTPVCHPLLLSVL